MSDKYLEFLDLAVTGSMPSEKFIALIFEEQRKNAATLNKVRDTIAFRLASATVAENDKTKLRKLRDDLNAYIARGCTDKTVREVLDSNVKYESDFKKNGSSPKPPKP